MPEPIVEEKKEKVEDPAKIVETPKEEGYDYAKDHGRDIREIAKEPVITPEKEKEPEAKKEESKPEKKEEVVNPLDEAKRFMDEQKKIAAQETEAKARETVEKELKAAKDRDKQEAKEQDDLKPLWEKEGRAPKDYNEIAAENRRITKLELKREMAAEREVQKAQEGKKQQEQQQAQQQHLNSINTKIGQELEELYTGGYLTRPKSADPTDAGEIEKKELFETGIKINLDRKEKGLPPIDSITKIFFMEYQPKRNAKPAQPAGGDAPIAGARPATVEQDTDGYNYARDHGKSFTQIAMEARKKQG